MPSIAAVLSSVLIGSAAYTLAPGLGYAVVLIMALLLALDPRIISSAQPGIAAWPLAGFALFNGLFMLHGLRTGLDFRMQLQHVLSLGVFVLSYTAWRAVLASKGGDFFTTRSIAIATLTTLAILFAGQLAEMAGMIDRRNLGVSQEDANYIFRPGGFLNPNMTAAIAVVVVFSLCESRARRLGSVGYLGIMLTLIIVLLTQSRTLIATLGCYLFLVGFRQPRLFLIVPFALLSAVAVAGGVASDALMALFERIIARFDGSLASDASNAERLMVLTEAIVAADANPWLGNGYMYLVEIVGASTHNQFAEMLVNFGAIGLVSAMIVFAMLFLPASLSAFLFCMLPTLMFSHNFFDNASFQASLGMALAIDSLSRAPSLPR
jgi:O-antigen ligase